MSDDLSAQVDRLVARLCEAAVREAAVSRLRAVGFRDVTLDLEGSRSGSFQRLIPSDALLRFAQSAP